MMHLLVPWSIITMKKYFGHLRGDRFSMKGNHSRLLQLNHAIIKEANIIGDIGDHTHYIFHIVLPNFLAAMSGTYLEIIQPSLDLTTQHLKKSIFTQQRISIKIRRFTTSTW